MHGDSAEVKKSVRKYMMVGGALYVATVVTVGAASLQAGIAVGIVIALIIAAVKGSMVAAVFMHLSSENRWIYGSLILTAFFFLLLLLIPTLSGLDAIGTHETAITVPDTPAEGGAEH